MSSARLTAVEVLETESVGLKALIDALSDETSGLSQALIEAVDTIKSIRDLPTVKYNLKYMNCLKGILAAHAITEQALDEPGRG